MSSRSFTSPVARASHGNPYQIVQGSGYVAIRYGMGHESRIIPLGGMSDILSAARAAEANGRRLQ